MSFLLIIILLLIYAYTLLILLFYLEIDQDADLPVNKKESAWKLSIVIPFRDEESHLPGVLEDLRNQSVSTEDWEVIFVDDHSTDGSASLFANMHDTRLRCRYLALPPGTTGKKNALACGIKHADYERILQVDADCRIGPGFISAHMAFLREHPSDLVAGIVSTLKGRGAFLESFERLDILALAGVSAGSFNLGRPMMCSGANLSYGKELYEETRTFDPSDSVASGDDMFLMIGARKLGKTVSFIGDRESIVRTAPRSTLQNLIKQRIRWGAKANRYKMADIQLLAMLVVLVNLSILLLPLLICFYLVWWPWMAGAWLLKTLADFLLLYKMTGICGSRSDLKAFLPVSLLYYPYFLVTVLGSFLGRSVWKGEVR